jgi:hypothetical protein
LGLFQQEWLVWFNKNGWFYFNKIVGCASTKLLALVQQNCWFWSNKIVGFGLTKVLGFVQQNC